MSFSTDRARADVAAGRLWKARDRLLGLLVSRQDAELLDLLAEVHHQMHNLPAAGAIWFVTGRDDQVARDAVAAWRDSNGDDEARWRSIPRPIRDNVHSRDLDALDSAARRVLSARAGGRGAREPYVESWGERLSALAFGGVALSVLALIGIGMWTVLHWIW